MWCCGWWWWCAAQAATACVWVSRRPQAEASDGGVFSVDGGYLLALAIDDGHVQLLGDVRLGQTGTGHRFKEPTEYGKHVAV